MRRLILQMGVSIGGFVAALDGSHPWGYEREDPGTKRRAQPKNLLACFAQRLRSVSRSCGYVANDSLTAAARACAAGRRPGKLPTARGRRPLPRASLPERGRRARVRYPNSSITELKCPSLNPSGLLQLMKPKFFSSVPLVSTCGFSEPTTLPDLS